MRISDWSSDVCSSDLLRAAAHRHRAALPAVRRRPAVPGNRQGNALRPRAGLAPMSPLALGVLIGVVTIAVLATGIPIAFGLGLVALGFLIAVDGRSEEHTSELQSLMRISYAVFCLKKKKQIIQRI